MDKEGVPCQDPNDAATGLVEIGADYDDDIAADTVTGGITAAASDENAKRKRKKNGEESMNETGVESPTNNSHGFVKPSSYELSEEQKEDYKEKRQEPQKKREKKNTTQSGVSNEHRKKLKIETKEKEMPTPKRKKGH